MPEFPTDCLYFHFDVDRRLILCQGCKTGVSGSEGSVGKHLSTHHAELPAAQRQEIQARWNIPTANALRPGMKEREAAARQLGYHPLLECQDGFICDINGCRHCCLKFDSMRTHRRTVHASNDTNKVVTRVSSLWKQPLTFFAVTEPAGDSHGDVLLQGAEARLEAALSQMDQQEQAFLLNQTRIILPASGHHNMWEARPGWSVWFAGLDMVQLHPLIEITPEDTKFATSRVRVQTRRLLERSSQWLRSEPGVRQTNTLALRLIHSVVAEVLPRPMEPVAIDSLRRYSRVWEGYILFLLRTAAWDEAQRARHRLYIPPEALKFALALRKLAAPFDMVVEDVVPEEDDENMQTHILELSRAVVEHRLDTNHQQHPLLYFLGVSGFNITNKTWTSAREHGAALSAVVYCVRILCLHHVYTAHPSDVVNQLRKYCRQYLHSGQPFIFDEIFSQRNFTTEVGRNYYAMPNVIWSQTRSTLIYAGQKIVMAHFRTMIQETCAATEDFLLKELLFNASVHTLDRCDPRQLVDNIGDVNNGHSLVTHNPSLQQGLKRTIKQLNSCPGHYASQVWCQKVPTIRSVLARYIESVRSFLQQLFILFYFGGGAPPRLSELCTTAWQNTQSSLRSWFVVHGKFTSIISYNKAEVRAHVPRMIARFYPHRIARLAIAFIADVLPFLAFLRSLNGSSLVDTHSPLVWHHDGKPAWDIANGLIKQVTNQYLGHELCFRDLRQIVVAIRTEHCPGQPHDLERDQPDDIDLAAWQAGHSSHTEQHHYAISADMLAGTTNETLAMFVQHSHRMHAFYGIADFEPITSSHPKKRVRHTIGEEDELRSIRQEVLDVRTDLRALIKILQDKAVQGKLLPTSPPPSLPTTPLTCLEAVKEEEHERWPRVLGILTTLYGPGASFRSTAQQQAACAMTHLDCPPDLIVRMPTGGGKTLLVEISALLEPTKVTVVVLPHLALRDDLQRRLQARGINVLVFDPHYPVTVSVILLTPESSLGPAFRNHMTSLGERGLLARIFWDEAHLIVTETNFRRWQEAIAFRPPETPRVFLSATLPQDILRPLYDAAAVDPARSLVIHGRSNNPKLQWDVTVVSTEDIYRRVGVEVNSVRGSLIIFVKSMADGNRLRDQHHWPFFHAGCTSEQRQLCLRDFRTGMSRVLIATTAASHGLDFDVQTVVVFKGGFDLVSLAQQAGRLCRNPGASGRCLILVSPAELQRRNQAPPGHPTPSLSGREGLEELLNTSSCRRQVIEGYLDSQARGPCSPTEAACDLCRQRRSDQVTAPVADDVQLDWAFDNTAAASSSPVRSFVPDSCTGSRPSSFSELFPSSPASSVTRSGSLQGLSTASSMVGASPSPFIGTDTLRTRLATAIASIEKQGYRCHVCWFARLDEHPGHLLAQCPFWQKTLRWSGVHDKLKVRAKELLKAVQVYRVHFQCLLPLGLLHAAGHFDFKADCSRSALLLATVRYGLDTEPYRAVLRRRCGIQNDQTDHHEILPVVIRQTSGPDKDLVIWELFLEMCHIRGGLGGRLEE